MVQIDIVLKMDDCEKQMTMDEARNLYFELNRLFNNGMQGQMNPPMSRPVETRMHPEVQKARETATKRTGGCGCSGNKKEPIEVKKTISEKKKTQ